MLLAEDGKLTVHPDFRCRGYGTMLLKEIERGFPHRRLELFTSDSCVYGKRTALMMLYLK